MGRIDVAGQQCRRHDSGIKPYHFYSEDEVKLEIERSLYPTLWCCLAALPIMMPAELGLDRECGLAIGSRPLPCSPMPASKRRPYWRSAKVLAMEYGRYGIRVNTMSTWPAPTIADRVTPRQLIRPGGDGR